MGGSGSFRSRGRALAPRPVLAGVRSGAPLPRLALLNLNEKRTNDTLSTRHFRHPYIFQSYTSTFRNIKIGMILLTRAGRRPPPSPLSADRLFGTGGSTGRTTCSW